MRAHRGVVAALLAALLLFAGACSGDDDAEQDDSSASSDDESSSGDEANGDDATGDGGASGDTSREAYVSAFGDTLEELVTDPADRQCMGAAVVDVVGLETLQATGTPEEVTAAQGTLRTFGVVLDEPTAGALYDAFQACVDLRALLLGGEEAASPDVLACLDSRIPEDLFRAYMVTSFTSDDGQTADPGLQEQLSAAMNECLAASPGQTVPEDGS